MSVYIEKLDKTHDDTDLGTVDTEDNFDNLICVIRAGDILYWTHIFYLTKPIVVVPSLPYGP